MKVFYSISIILLLVAQVVADNGNRGKKAEKSGKPEATDFARNYVPVLKTAKKITLAVAEAMPEEKYSYKPTEVSKTFAEQMIHIAYTTKIMEEMHIQGREQEFQEPAAEGKSKQDIKNMLIEAFDHLIASAGAISEQELKTTVSIDNTRSLSKQYVYMFIHDHLTNHRAKANLYIRMNGLEPPKYVF